MILEGWWMSDQITMKKLFYEQILFAYSWGRKPTMVLFLAIAGVFSIITAFIPPESKFLRSLLN